MVENMEIKWPTLKMNFSENKVLVLAPHVDDEVIGCGGSICKYTSKNTKVYITYMTDGSKGTLNNKEDMALAQIRKEEAHNIKEILGVEKCFFIDLKDRGEWDIEKAAADLAKIIDEIKPDAVYVPPSNDLHIDHQKTNKILQQIIISGKYNGLIYVYEIWTPINPNIIINITEFMDKKKEALAVCQSQTGIMDYKKMMFALNAYRACFIPLRGVDYAEAFWQLSCCEFINV